MGEKLIMSYLVCLSLLFVGQIKTESMSRISVDFEMPISKLVDTCQSYAEEKAASLRQRIEQLEEENRALRNGQTYTPNYLRDYPSNTGANTNIISPGTGAVLNNNNACQSNPCMNGGLCQPYVNSYGYKCNCILNYGGPNCQRMTAMGNTTSNFNTGHTGAVINHNTNHSFNNNAKYTHPRSCRDIYINHAKNGYQRRLTDSIYSIKPDKNGNFLSVFCNMTAGGWTLVYAYTFTRGGPTIGDFTSLQNAVTPIPTWSLKVPSDRTVRVSTTPPRNETDYNAVDFNLWYKIGRDFLVKSNFVNWYKCSPGNGSLVDMKTGTVKCTMTQKLYHTKYNGCFGAPTWFDSKKYNYGPRLGTMDGTYFYWEASETHNFPTHNPCDSFTMPANLNLSQPRGAIYLY